MAGLRGRVTGRSAPQTLPPCTGLELELLDLDVVSFISPPLEDGSLRPWASAAAHLGCNAGIAVGTSSRGDNSILLLHC